MPRFPKRLLALGGLAAGGAAFVRSRRGGQAADPAPAPAAPAAPASPPAPPVSTVGAAESAPVVAPPPVEAPGPSVNAPTAGGPGSDTERAEAAEATVPLPDPATDTPAPEEVASATATDPPTVAHTDDDFVAAEEAAAAAEARGIGGPRLDDAHGDEAMEAVYEAGGGEAEGFELAEDQLIENASHGGGRADPLGDAFTPEVESDEQTAVYGEPDEERVSELDEDDTDRR
jgi:hypothetical protein